MKNIDDLRSSVQRMHAGYSASRIEREIVRGWVLGLGDYPPPLAAVLADAKAWFRTRHDLVDDETKARDLACLQAVLDGKTA